MVPVSFALWETKVVKDRARNRFDSWLSCPGVKSRCGEPVLALTEPSAITRAVGSSPLLKLVSFPDGLNWFSCLSAPAP